MKTIYLKAPYYNQLRKLKNKFCIQLYGNYENGEAIEIKCANTGFIATIQSVSKYTLSDVPWKVLDSLGYRSHDMLFYQLCAFYDVRTITEITVLELITQPKRRKIVQGQGT